MSGLFKKPKVDVPEPPPPAPFPDPEDPSIAEKKRRTAMDIMSRAGRRSTILSQAGGTGGGSSYSGRALG